MTKASDGGPNDRFNLSLILFYSMGILTQVTNSFILNAQLYFVVRPAEGDPPEEHAEKTSKYWRYKFRDADKEWDPANDSLNELQKEFTADVSVVGNVTTLVTLALAVLFTRRWNVTYRMLACCCIYISIFLLIVMFALIDTDSWQRAFFYTTMVIVALAKSTNSLYLIALLHLCAKFPPIYLSAMLSGQVMCGIFSSSVQILTLIIDGTPEANGLLYFSVAVLCVIVTFIMFLINCSRSNFFQYQMKRIAFDQAARVSIKKEFIITVFKNQQINFLALLLVTLATTIIQPGLTSTIRSMDQGNGNKWNDTYFVPVITFWAYSICDVCGRELAMRVAKPSNSVAILIFSLCRIPMVVMLLMCNLSVKEHTPVIVQSDIIYILMQLLLGLTNGFGLNICIVSAPINFQNPEEEKTLTLAILAIINFLGDAIGSALGLILVKIL